MTECVFALELFQKLHLVFKDCSGKKTFETSVHPLVLLWNLCRSILSFTCSVLYVIACTFYLANVYSLFL